MEIVPVSEVGEDWASRKPLPKAPGRVLSVLVSPAREPHLLRVGRVGMDSRRGKRSASQ